MSRFSSKKILVYYTVLFLYKNLRNVYRCVQKDDPHIFRYVACFWIAVVSVVMRCILGGDPSPGIIHSVISSTLV